MRSGCSAEPRRIRDPPSLRIRHCAQVDADTGPFRGQLEEKNTDPTRASEASPAAAAMENSPTEQQSKISKKKGICAFFRRKWRAVKRAALRYQRGNKVASDPFALDPVATRDPADLQPGLSIPFWVIRTDPGPSGFELTVTANQDPVDSHSTLAAGPAGLVAELTSVPGPSSHELMPAPSPPSLMLKPDVGLDVPEPKPLSGSSLGVMPAVDLADSEPTSASGPSSYRLTRDTDVDNARQKFVPVLSGYWPTAAPLSSRYDVGVKLGQGAFGSVYKGTRRSNGQKVALKFLTNKAWNNYINMPGSTKPLLVEVAMNAVVCAPPKSPNIVEMIEWFEEPDRYVIVMEYPHPCETLLAFCVRHGCRLDESVARGLMRQAVLAAKHCIERGVLHNDIKSDNMLVNTETLQLKLIDFGCSERINISSAKECEWANGSVVWSLAIVLLELVNGNQPISVSLSKASDDLLPTFSNGQFAYGSS
ncbi:serine threonine- kinase pim-2-like protein [Labeo rohita]|uniref:non-specific serine/threonine protein kinase n=1 Tax=Labeo rohita TaxID=84645 RepID=A0A498LMB4_LABRO|nr:serine threonine- kinase pim-2-like protein [Labeo rohita]